MQRVVVKVAQVEPWPEAPVPLHLWPPLRSHAVQGVIRAAAFHERSLREEDQVEAARAKSLVASHLEDRVLQALCLRTEH